MLLLCDSSVAVCFNSGSFCWSEKSSDLNPLLWHLQLADKSLLYFTEITSQTSHLNSAINRIWQGQYGLKRLCFVNDRKGDFLFLFFYSDEPSGLKCSWFLSSCEHLTTITIHLPVGVSLPLVASYSRWRAFEPPWNQICFLPAFLSCFLH